MRGCSAGCAAGGCSLCSALEHVNNHYTCLNNSAAAARCSSQQQRPGAGWKYGLHQRAAGTDTASHQAAATQITAKPRCYAAKHRYVDIFIEGRAKVFTLFVSPSCQWSAVSKRVITRSHAVPILPVAMWPLSSDCCWCASVGAADVRPPPLIMPITHTKCYCFSARILGIVLTFAACMLTVMCLAVPIKWIHTDIDS